MMIGGVQCRVSAFLEGSGAWPYLVWKTAQKLDKIKGLSSGRSVGPECAAEQRSVHYGISSQIGCVIGLFGRSGPVATLGQQCP